MKEFNLIAIPAYEFFADEALINEVKNCIKDVVWQQNVSNSMSKDTFYNENLYNWFHNCLEQVRAKYYSDSLSLVITACWANKTDFLQYHQPHGHINSMVSGSFYLDDYTCPLEFVMEDPWHRMQNLNILGVSKTKGPNHIVSQIVPKRGQLILFPSEFEHSVPANKEKKTRYSISFNAFVSGTFKPNAISAELKIQSSKV